ncbi:hypothetical protein ACP70R_004223 [Stipagrostis hirtigluma subsp. patula]
MAASSADRIGALPDEALLNVLSFLPAREAVRTSLLAQRWRYLWRSTPRLRIDQRDGFETIAAMNDFVNRLLLFRDHSSALEECQFDVETYFTDDCKHVDLWIRQALCCQVHSLRFQGLMKLHLDSVSLKGCFLDFSSCPVLEDLKMTSCVLDTFEISSNSLKQLSIIESDFDSTTHARIFVPSLVSLEIADYWGLSPLLESMPALVTAFIRIGETCEDYNIIDDDSDDSVVLLRGLSDAANLELTAKDDKTCIFRRDLRCCPIFSKLKTLVLNEWCMDAYISSLIHFLQHSPILEKLTLQLAERTNCTVDIESSYILRNQCFASEHLKIVEVKCYENDERMREVIKVFSSCGVPPERISVQHWNFPSSSFSFEQKESHRSTVD